MARPIYTILHMDTLRRAYSSERLEQTLTPGRSTLEEYRSGVFHDVFLKIQMLSGAMRSHLRSDTARVRRVIRLLTTKLLLEVAPTTLAAFFIL